MIQVLVYKKYFKNKVSKDNTIMHSKKQINRCQQKVNSKTKIHNN